MIALFVKGDEGWEHRWTDDPLVAVEFRHIYEGSAFPIVIVDLDTANVFPRERVA